MKISNTYLQLGTAFSESINPLPVADPHLLLWNQSLVDQLALSQGLPDNENALAQLFSGNDLLPEASPIACVYAGHQFGQFNPQLGDGRAHLLCEFVDDHQQRWDLQLKGSGPTRYSRRGDGRCALGPAIREYLMSEALHALGVPTTRCLAVVTTGETVYRDLPKPGAVVTRIASSHIRVGSFQYFAAKGDIVSLKTLTDYTIDRHFPTLKAAANPVLELLGAVMDKQVTLIVEWMRIGFIHGVMNTDNTAISGETIDFGPCAMLGIYHPGTVYSSIDSGGRYAFGAQPSICRWNMARLAEALLPLIDEDQDKALAQAEALIADFSPRFEQAYQTMLGAKLGLDEIQQTDVALITELLEQLQEQQLDYTQTFHQLTRSLTEQQIATKLQDTLGDWYGQWRQRIGNDSKQQQAALALMQQSNPVVIPRNHHVEAVLQACELTNSSAPADALLKVLRSPYQMLAETADYQDLPTDNDRHYQTFCGT
ncbi:YdiU family protein [Corallincola luteus]|uniref:Protein nucleotidyltransferase YdiU n=1 Tax=Corallincola luteus TaxID=1775177 RepID=A0ABY2AMH9_9GAMM|nr:YdiU family protein [Corallincola luteus]TCI04400.1 YdiU family protein [Corallincola luteus]